MAKIMSPSLYIWSKAKNNWQHKYLSNQQEQLQPHSFTMRPQDCHGRFLVSLVDRSSIFSCCRVTHSCYPNESIKWFITVWKKVDLIFMLCHIDEVRVDGYVSKAHFIKILTLLEAASTDCMAAWHRQVPANQWHPVNMGVYGYWLTAGHQRNCSS